MDAKVLAYLPLLGISAGLNILFGVYNNVFAGKYHFDWKVFFLGVTKAGLFCLSILGLSYIFTHIEIPVTILNPESLMETGVIYYTGKVVFQLKDMLLPKDSNWEEIRKGNPDEIRRKRSKTNRVSGVQIVDLEDEEDR